MKKNFLYLMVSFIFYSCEKDESAVNSSFQIKAVSADYNSYPQTVQTVSGSITTNTTWTNDKVWEISGVVTVKNGATLTIEAGTFIKGKLLAPGVATGVLVITKTGKIDAQGTEFAPIVFTSYNLLDDNSNTIAFPGDFGGVVILGDAEVNTGSLTNIAEGLDDQPNFSEFYYGGSNNMHSSGSLHYVRIEYAGRILDSDNEINGLTLAGVGSETVIDHIQVSYAKDDSFEFFGGKVNATHLVSFAPEDDNFDFDLGYTGTITKAIAIANSDATHSFIKGYPDSNGIELDNNGPGFLTLTITRPVISQMSIIGVSSGTFADLYENAIDVRRAGNISLTDVTVTGYNKGINWSAPSVKNGSFLLRLSVHAFDYPVLPLGSPLVGLGTSTSTVDPAPKWNITQPFYNNEQLNFTGHTGAFKEEMLWTKNWVRFPNFQN